jgi:hypothetical protein
VGGYDPAILPIADGEGCTFEQSRNTEHDEIEHRRADRVRIGKLDIALVEREDAAREHDQDSDDERLEIDLHPIAERMTLVGRALLSANADQEKQLVRAVGRGVDSFCQHCARAGHCRRCVLEAATSPFPASAA